MLSCDFCVLANGISDILSWGTCLERRVSARLPGHAVAGEREEALVSLWAAICLAQQRRAHAPVGSRS